MHAPHPTCTRTYTCAHQVSEPGGMVKKKRKDPVLKRVAPTSTALDRFSTKPKERPVAHAQSMHFRKSGTLTVPEWEPRWVPPTPAPAPILDDTPDDDLEPEDSPPQQIDGSEILQRMLDKIAEDQARRLRPTEPALVKPIYMEEQPKSFDKADALLEELGIKEPEPEKRVLKYGDLLDQGGWKFKTKLTPTNAVYTRRGAVALIDQAGKDGMEILFIQEKDGKLSYTHPKRRVTEELRKLGASDADQ